MLIYGLGACATAVGVVEVPDRGRNFRTDVFLSTRRGSFVVEADARSGSLRSCSRLSPQYITRLLTSGDDLAADISRSLVDLRESSQCGSRSGSIRGARG